MDDIVLAKISSVDHDMHQDCISTYGFDLHSLYYHCENSCADLLSASFLTLWKTLCTTMFTAYIRPDS
jgi:hypothetical protein